MLERTQDSSDFRRDPLAASLIGHRVGEETLPLLLSAERSVTKGEDACVHLLLLGTQGLQRMRMKSRVHRQQERPVFAVSLGSVIQLT